MSSPVPDRAISAAVEPWRIDRDQWKVRAEAAEAALEATKTERDKIGQRLRDRTGEWKLALHQRDEERARAEAAEARTVQLEAALWEFAELDSYHGPYGSTSQEQWVWDTERAIAERARALLSPEVISPADQTGDTT